MAYSIGPKFNPIDIQPIMDNYKTGVDRMDKQHAAEFEQMMTGLKGIGTGIGKARQWEEAEKIQKDLQDKLQALLDSKAAMQNELNNINSLRDEAKGTVSGIDTMLAGYSSVLDPNNFNVVQKIYGRKAGL